MSILLQTDSLLTTVQDLGRYGHRALGINPNGVMDRAAARLINILLGNSESEAVLEIHYPGPKILFERDTRIALGGADFAAKLDNDPVDNWRTIMVRKGQTLRFAEKVAGNRLYLSVTGGFQVNEWLGSRSTNLKAGYGGFGGRRLARNDRILFNDGAEYAGSDSQLRISPYSLPDHSTMPTIRIIEGAEFSLVTPLSAAVLQREYFKVSPTSDRMGFRLEGEPLHLLHEKELISSAVTFGTLQLLPNGQIIILMADHQTTGGYPRIANVVSVDLPLLAQLGANDKIKFSVISLAEAEAAAIEFERALSFLRTGVKFRKGF